MFLEKPVNLDNEQASALAESLNDRDRRRHKELVTPDARETFLLSRALLRSLLASPLGRAAPDIGFEEGPHGKPKLDATFGSSPPIGFNVSHSPTHVLVGLSTRGEVGVDVETIRTYDDRLPGRFFSPAEVRALEELPPRQRGPGFFHLWVVKEACIKALGLPLGPTIASVTASLDNRGRHQTVEWEALKAPPGTKAAIAVDLRDAALPLEAGVVRYATLADLLSLGDP